MTVGARAGGREDEVGLRRQRAELLQTLGRHRPARRGYGARAPAAADPVRPRPGEGSTEPFGQPTPRTEDVGRGPANDLVTEVAQPVLPVLLGSQDRIGDGGSAPSPSRRGRTCPSRPPPRRRPRRPRGSRPAPRTSLARPGSRPAASEPGGPAGGRSRPTATPASSRGDVHQLAGVRPTRCVGPVLLPAQEAATCSASTPAARAASPIGTLSSAGRCRRQSARVRAGAVRRTPPNSRTWPSGNGATWRTRPSRRRVGRRPRAGRWSRAVRSTSSGAGHP